MSDVRVGPDQRGSVRPRLRRVADGAHSRGFHHVLLAVSDAGRSWALAEAFHERALLPAVTFSAEQVAHYAAKAAFDLIVLDLDADDDTLARLVADITAEGSQPVLVLGDAAPDIRALVDDFVPTEVDAHRVVERAHRLVELSRPVDLPEPLRWGALELDVRRRTAAWNGNPLELTSLQFRIMEVLVLAAGAVVTIDELSRRVWGESAFDDRDRLVAHIRRIRKRIASMSFDGDYVVTVRGQGFRLDEPPVHR